VTGTAESELRDLAFYATATGQLVHKLKKVDGNARVASYLAVAPAGDLFATYNANAELFLRTADKNEVVARLAGHTGSIYLARFAPGGKRLISFSFDGTLRVWDIPAK
jgi:WD40 repeat protein